MTSLDSAYVDRPHYARQNTFRPLSLRSASPFTRTALPFARSRPLATSSGTNSDDSARQSLALSVTDSDYSSSKNSIHLIPVYNSRAATGGATNTGPKGVIADWRLATAIHHVAGHHEANLSGLLQLTNRAPTSEGSEYAGSIREGEGGCEKFCDRRRSLEMTRGKVFGHLREIGVGQFSRAIEEHSSIAFVIHLYEPVSLPSVSLEIDISSTSISSRSPSTSSSRILTSSEIFTGIRGLRATQLPSRIDRSSVSLCQVHPSSRIRHDSSDGSRRGDTSYRPPLSWWGPHHFFRRD